MTCRQNLSRRCPRHSATSLGCWFCIVTPVKLSIAGFRNLLEYLRPGDLLVLNNSRVIPARLRGINAHTGGQFEILLLEENATNDWWVMLRPGKRARVGTQIILRDTRRPADWSARHGA